MFVTTPSGATAGLEACAVESLGELASRALVADAASASATVADLNVVVGGKTVTADACSKCIAEFGLQPGAKVLLAPRLRGGTRVVPALIFVGIMAFDLFGMFAGGWVHVAFRADGKLCHFPLRDCTLAACATNSAVRRGFIEAIQAPGCVSFNLAFLVLFGEFCEGLLKNVGLTDVLCALRLTASFCYTTLFMIYLVGCTTITKCKMLCRWCAGHPPPACGYV